MRMPVRDFGCCAAQCEGADGRGSIRAPSLRLRDPVRLWGVALFLLVRHTRDMSEVTYGIGEGAATRVSLSLPEGTAEAIRARVGKR